MKKSLVISEKDKYGDSAISPAVAEGGKQAKPKARKFAPTIELIGPQVDAFCACELKVGDTGTATVHYTVKSVGSNSPSYGDEVSPAEKKPSRVTLQLTHVEAEGEGEDDKEEAGEDPAEEKTESPEDETAEEGAEEDDSPASPKKETMSPKDAGLDE